MNPPPPERERVPIPDRASLERAYAAIEDIHKRHLHQHGVKLPGKNSYQWIWLAMLHHYQERMVHKDDIAKAVQSIHPDAAQDQQVRHLKRRGWNVTEAQGWHQLADPYRPSQEYINEQARRRGRLDAKSFADIRQAFGGRCATCGAVEGEPDPRYGARRVQLQQGHQDPDAAAEDPANIIPQCQFCNRAYKRDFVFDARGRVRAVASPSPVQRARRQVRKKIWNFLRREFARYNRS